MGDFVPGTRWVLAYPAAKLSHARPATRNIPRAMPALVPHLSKISTVIALLAMTVFDAVAQDDPPQMPVPTWSVVSKNKTMEAETHHPA